MPNFTIIPATDPLCKEIQDGYSNYNDGLILADSRFTDLDGEWLVGPVKTLPEGYYRNERDLYANVHFDITRRGGQTVRGIRFWTERCSDRGYMSYSPTGLAQDRAHTVSRAYIGEHYDDVQEADGVITCMDRRDGECLFNEVSTLDGWFVKNREQS